MPDGNEIGARIVLTGESSSAQAAVKGTTDSVKGLRDEGGKFVSSGTQVGDKIKEIGDHATSASGAGIGKLKGSLVELGGQIPGVTGGLSTFGEVAEAVEAGPLALLAVGVGVVAAGIEGVKKGVEEFSKIEVADTKLDQALAQAGQLTDAYREKLQGLGKELQETSGIAEERWMAVLARLTQFGADDTNIEEYSKAVENLAGLMGGNIERAGMIFTRAMNGNTAVLGRLGIQVDKTASSHEKLEQIMAQLAQKGGGQLEAQTKTISGQFTALEHATADLFKGIGNLVSRTEVLQVTLHLAGEALKFFAGFFPSTVKEVEGLTNKLPPLKDELGHVRAAADDAGEEMGDMGDSAQGAAGGLETAGKAAGKAKDEFEEAADAAKKLREQQDQLADARTALALAKITAAEDRGQISKGDADQQRAGVRAGAEQAKIGREVQEQETIYQTQQKKQGEGYEDTKVAGQKTRRAGDEYSDASTKAGLSADEAAQLAAASEKDGKNLFSLLAEKRRADAEEKRMASASVPDNGDDKKKYEDLQQGARAADEQARAIDDLAKKFIALRQARSDEEAASKTYAETEKETTTAMADARAKLQVLALNQQKATLTASSEQTKLDNAAEKKRLEEEQKRLEHSLKNDAMPDATAAADQAKFRANQLSLNKLQYGGDKAGLAVANATLPVPPGAEANVKLREQIIKEIDDSLKLVPNLTPGQKEGLTRARDAHEKANDAENERGDAPLLRTYKDFNSARERGERDDKDTGGGAGVAAAARAVGGEVAAAGPATPGTVSGAAQAQVQALTAKLLQGGGEDKGINAALIQALHQYIDARARNGDRDPKLEADVQALTVKVNQLTNQIKNQR